MFKESLILFNEIGAKRQVAECVTDLAQIASEQRKVERAATLFGASKSLRQAINYILTSAEQAEFERGVIATRTQLTASAFDDAWTTGCTLTVQQAVAYALERAGPGASLRATHNVR